MENSKIEWTDHTFNPWIGCTKVSPGCKHCYAEALDKRWGRNNWGPNASRTKTSAANWKKPLQWQKNHGKFYGAHGRRQRVFCASLADVFEIPGNEAAAKVVEFARYDLWELITITPHLDWLLLTKRPENIMELIPEEWHFRLPENIWIGTTVENQETANERIPHLLEVPARVRFLSCEPMVGPIDFTRIKAKDQDAEQPDMTYYMNALMTNAPYIEVYTGDEYPDGNNENLVDGPTHEQVNWVIVGGESGHGARPMHPDWARSLRDQCVDAEVPFLFKQWGNWFPLWQADEASHFPKAPLHQWEDGIWSVNIGKKAAGRLLDGVEHNEFPV